MGKALPAYDPDATVQEALAAYFETYGLGAGGYDKPYEIIKLFGFLPVLLPNPPSRKRALRCHDLNHVLGSYDAILTSGEIDIAGFELGAIGGCRTYGVAWGINAFFFGLGILVRPRHVFRAFMRARGAYNAYSLPSAEGDVLNRRLADLRTELGIPDHASPASLGRVLYFLVWAAIGLTLLLGPVALTTWVLLG